MVPHSTNQRQQSGSAFVKGGAALFGLCGMVLSGMQFGSVLDDSYAKSDIYVYAAHSILEIVFILFLWIFVCAYTNVCIPKWNCFARIAVMCLWATCISGWCNEFVGEIGHHFKNPFDYDVCNSSTVNSSATGLDFRNENNDFSHMIEDSSAILVPGVMEFYLVMSGFMYVIHGNIGRQATAQHHAKESKYFTLEKSFKGLALGGVILVLSIVIVIYHEVEEDENGEKSAIVYYLYGMAMYPLTIIGNLNCHFKMRWDNTWKINDSREDGLRLTMLLLFVSTLGMFVSAILNIIACSMSPEPVTNYAVLLIHECFKIVEVFCQVIFLYDALHRDPPKEFKPGIVREIMMCMAIVYFTYFWMTVYELKAEKVNRLQYCFYGYEVWSIILHLLTPLGIYCRFHAVLMYLELWISG
ncbi:proton channel OTOP2-like [Saccoglossus kowalevskii]